MVSETSALVRYQLSLLTLHLIEEYLFLGGKRTMQPRYPQPPYPPQGYVKRRTVSAYCAMGCLLGALVADFIGMALIGLAWLQLQGMNILTSVGQIQAASQLIGPIIAAFIFGSFLKTGGLYFLIVHLS